jgi:hypothetical protein
VVMAVIISYLVIRQRRRRAESIKVSAVQDRLELPPPPPPDPHENSEFQREEKSDGPVQPTSPGVEPDGLQEIEERGAGRANGHVSITSLGRTTLMGGSGSEITEDHTRARVHALERMIVSLMARLGMNVPEAPPPSYASESG